MVSSLDLRSGVPVEAVSLRDRLASIELRIGSILMDRDIITARLSSWHRRASSSAARPNARDCRSGRMHSADRVSAQACGHSGLQV